MKMTLHGRFNHTGMGRHAEYVYRALAARTDTHYALAHTDPDDAAAVDLLRATQTDDDVTLFFTLNKAHLFEGIRGRKILWFVFESDRLPSRWLGPLNAYDFIWTPSEWGRDVLVGAGLPPGKIIVMPEGVDAQAYRPSLAAHEGFVFLSVGKYEKRKGISELIRAFVDEFPAAKYPAPELWLKADFPMFPKVAQLLKAGVAFDPRIRVIDGERSDAEMVELYQRADAFIFPSRAEGFGLPCIEALACGIPVVAVNYSGQTQFLADVEGLYIPIAYRMEDIQDPLFDQFYKDIFAGESYGRWAVPDTNSIRRGMRQVFEHQAVWKERALQASSRIRDNFDWAVIAARVSAELAALGQG